MKSLSTAEEAFDTAEGFPCTPFEILRNQGTLQTKKGLFRQGEVCYTLKSTSWKDEKNEGYRILPSRYPAPLSRTGH
jgi:hypothetical protein